MITTFVVLVVAVGAVWYFFNRATLDVNKDGKVNAEDAKAAVAEAKEEVKEVVNEVKQEVAAVEEKVVAAVKKPGRKKKNNG